MKRQVGNFGLKLMLALATLIGAFAITPGQLILAATDHQIEEIKAVNSYLPEDINKHWAADTLYDLIHADIVKGYVDREGQVTIQPDKRVTRAEFVALLVNTLGLQKNKEQDPISFSDIEPNEWYYEPVNIASSLGIVKGVGRTVFGPNRYITRGEIAALITRAFAYTVAFDETKAKHFKDVGQGYWASREVAKASSVKIINGYPGGYFKPFEYATRAEAMVMLSHALYLEENAVASDKTLLEVVRTANEKEERAFQALDIASLKEIGAKHYTGYRKATHDLTVAVLQKLKEEGYTVQITCEGKLEAQVIGKWNRIAVVEVNGLTYRLKAVKDGEELQSVQHVKGMVMLKKGPMMNEWRVYTSDVPLLVTKKMLSVLETQS
ncbi:MULTISPECIES: S-layer homology domain-containing protein [Aneurinibacillus]|uniref:S-layer homology domain-containing protein n=1 Tax=Aneurinibacillus thermoaerophilus TaxID=143495 RepID=A0A1G8A8M8_ANETH|nr:MULTISPECIES: S-layer homology domain-containing protein [Aneurinibacillus]MED0675432.1 S-layer homology domain-containing protein [Aneurinibacillus thermoaerophilus]MED0678785.1 S-layer homology domain-containing protein [Aneurinibacillus thermoaerophilus]MED0736660.1 S-layer homology domain-containing protein [Aneurinibacillus thermoaerophilus]MED0758315.1 S-layer homology domain-containing protein [Aneurinibacillus thermoaerophilus]MED0759878.1 S-layer homology domain-containing protein 